MSRTLLGLWITSQHYSDTPHSDPEHASPFTKLSDIVSALSAIGQLDVYSLSREAIQRMLPRQPEPERPAAAAPSPPDTRSFQYRFSMAYIRKLPEGQRPVEREVFGKSRWRAGWLGLHVADVRQVHSAPSSSQAGR